LKLELKLEDLANLTLCDVTSSSSAASGLELANLKQWLESGIVALEVVGQLVPVAHMPNHESYPFSTLHHWHLIHISESHSQSLSQLIEDYPAHNLKFLLKYKGDLTIFESAFINSA
jgi:hypothetical protein